MRPPAFLLRRLVLVRVPALVLLLLLLLLLLRGTATRLVPTTYRRTQCNTVYSWFAVCAGVSLGPAKEELLLPLTLLLLLLLALLHCNPPGRYPVCLLYTCIDSQCQTGASTLDQVTFGAGEASKFCRCSDNACYTGHLQLAMCTKI